MAGRPPAHFCVWGHDTDLVGRYPNGTCKLCHRTRRKEARARGVEQAAYDMRRNGAKVPARRLTMNRTREDAGLAWASRWGCDLPSGMRAAYRLWGASRITVDCADRWCVALGTHLAIVYPEVFYEPTRKGADIPVVFDDEEMMA